MKHYLYETHLHTAPVSRCAKASVEDTLTFYRDMGYDGVFLTNHFIDGNINIAHDVPFKDKLDFYFSDYHKGVEFGKTIGLKVFLGVEMSYKGTDFLIYGLDEAFYYAHPEIEAMNVREKLHLYRSNGAIAVQAHPFREDFYIDHIRLYPRDIDGVEVVNAGRTELENKMASVYREQYGFRALAGTDNHRGKENPKLAGIATQKPINTVNDFLNMFEAESYELFEVSNTVDF